MKKLAVAVLSEDMGYAKALSRGLAEERKNIYIKPICVDNFSAAQREKLIDELTELGYILVADFDINERDELIILTECDVCDLCCNKISKFSPVRAIFQKITEIYFEKNKIEFSYLMEDDTKILGVLSPWHSSGSTVFSIALGRTFAMKTDDPVLYINAGIYDDYMLYMDKSSEKSVSKKELIYNIIQKYPWNMEKYLIKDKYGLFYLCGESGTNTLSERKCIEKLILGITKKKMFSYIIIDGMMPDMDYICHEKIAICDCRYKRTYFDVRDEDYIQIYNFSYKEDNKCIPKDEESFQVEENHICISMEGVFADKINTIADEVLA